MNLIDKHNTQPFEGWAYDSSANKDEMILADLLKRKSTMTNLPPLHQLKIRNSSQQHIPIQAKHQPLRLKHIFNKSQNKHSDRIKTEGLKQFYNDAISPLKKKLVEILNAQQNKNPAPPIIEEQAHQNLAYITKIYLQPNQQQNFQNEYVSNNKDQDPNQLLPFEEQLQLNKKQPVRSQLKKKHSKMYMKLNTLQVLSEFRKNMYHQPPSIKNLASKHQITQPIIQTQKTTTHKNIFSEKFQMQQKVEKVSEKLKQTFFKYDVFEREKKKKQKVQKLHLVTQFNDQVIFSSSPFKTPDKLLSKRINSLRAIQKGISSRPDLSIPIKIRRQNSPHHYKLTIL